MRTKMSLFFNFKNPSNKKMFERQNAFLATIIVLAIYLIGIFKIGIYYEVNDDAAMAYIASGAYGPGGEHLIFTNIFIGYFLKALFLITHAVNWYALFYIVLEMICCTILLTILMNSMGKVKGTIVFAVFFFVFGFNLMLSLQFTEVSAILLITGLVLIARHLGTFGPSVWCGIALTLLGSMIRFDNFYAIGGLASCVLLWRFYYLDKKKYAVCSMLILLISAFALQEINLLCYENDAEWNSYMEYNEVRSSISDFQILRNSNSQLLEPLGNSVNDLCVLENWDFDDPNVFPTEKLKVISNLLPPGHGTIKDSLKNTLESPFYSPDYFYKIVVVLSIFGVCLLFCDKKCWLPVIGTIVILLAEFTYLHYLGRFIHRVFWGIDLAAAVFIFMCLRTKPKYRTAVLGMILLISVPIILGYYPTIERTVQDAYHVSSWRTRSSYDAMSADKEHLYIFDVVPSNEFFSMDVWDVKPENYLSNMLACGGWTSETPFKIEALEQYGYHSVYEALASKDSQVILCDIDSRLEMKEKFIREHYGVDGKFELIYELEGVKQNLYQLKDVN